MEGHPLYKTWENMKQRCFNPNNPKYKHYGGRGVTVCARWVDSFSNFLADMGERPPNPAGWVSRMPYWTLDRINPAGDYEPGNCRWATPEQQITNKRG